MSDLPSIDFTSRDFDTIIESLKLHLKSRFPDTYTDFTESSMGMALLELTAYVYDLLSYMLDATANELYLPTAQDRESVINICKLVGYDLDPATSASVVCELTIDAVQAQDVIIAQGTQIVTENDLVFELAQEATITAGTLEGEGTFTHGETKEDNFTSDGSANQSFELANNGVANGTIVVEVNGTEWDEQDSLVYGDSTSEIYTIDYDENDKATISFGDGSSGYIPPNTASIKVTYRVGGGVEGNIAIGQVNQTVVGTLQGVAPPVNVTVTVYNAERGSGGLDRETISYAKYWAPRYVHANGRAVTKQDFTTLATLFRDSTYGGPAYACAELRQEVPELNTVDVYLWSLDSNGRPTTAGSGLIAAMQEYFDNNDAGAIRLISVDTEVQSGMNLYLDLELSVKTQSGFNATEVLNDVLDAISALLVSASNQPGQDFRLSLLYKTVQEVAGVEYAIIDEMVASLASSYNLGTGNGVLTNFAGTLPNTPVAEGSISISDGTQTVTDDGDGNLQGDVAASGTNTIDYTTGALDVTFANAPVGAAAITVTYRYVTDTQRGEVELTSTGAARIRGKLNYAPVVPGTFAISDGSQTVTDDGDGNVQGDIDATGRNTVIYESGSYDFTFEFPPSVGNNISSTYRQYLDSVSEDVPVEDSQLVVEGNVVIRSL